jgi:hypothetical protein
MKIYVLTSSMKKVIEISVVGPVPHNFYCMTRNRIKMYNFWNFNWYKPEDESWSRSHILFASMARKIKLHYNLKKLFHVVCYVDFRSLLAT